MTIQGFDFEPDAAIADAIDRAQRYLAKGWKLDEYDSIPVQANTRNPYSEHPVYGYVANLDLFKDVTDERIPREPF